MASASTFCSETGYLDFSAILNAPSYDPATHSLVLTRGLDIASDYTDNEDDSKLMNSNFKNIFKDSLQKFKIVQGNDQKKSERENDKDDVSLVKSNIDKIPDLGKFVVWINK